MNRKFHGFSLPRARPRALPRALLFAMLGTALTLSLSLSGCTSALNGSGASEDNIALAAGIASDFAVMRASEMSSGNESLLSSDSQTMSAVLAEYEASSETARALQSGEDVTVEDLGDGTVRITRTWSIDDDEVVKNVVVRPVKPKADDPLFTNGELSQSGSEQRFVNDVKISDMTLTIVWKTDGTDAYRYHLVREGEKFKLNGAFTARTDSEWDASGALVQETVSYVKTDADGSPVARTFVFTEVTIDGIAYRKIVSSDRDGWAIVKSRNPRVVEYYDASGEKRLVVTHERVPLSGIAITRDYWKDGVLVRTESGTMRVSTSGGVMTMKKTVGGVTVTAAIEETGSGYTVTRNGVSYAVTFNPDGTVTVRTSSASFLVTFLANGETTITEL